MATERMGDGGRNERRIRDCRPCGGGGCDECADTGIEVADTHVPPADFTVAGDDEGFGHERENCPCYEGISINPGANQCMHPDNHGPENWCSPEVCPLLAARSQP